MSEDEVEFDIVDLIGSTSLESLQNYGVLLVRNLHLEVVEDGAEPCEVHKARSALVLILKVWLDQESSVLHISS